VAWVGRLYEGRAHRPVNKRINCRWVRIIGGCQRPAGHAGPVKDQHSHLTALFQSMRQRGGRSGGSSAGRSGGSNGPKQKSLSHFFSKPKTPAASPAPKNCSPSAAPDAAEPAPIACFDAFVHGGSQRATDAHPTACLEEAPPPTNDPSVSPAQRRNAEEDCSGPSKRPRVYDEHAMPTTLQPVCASPRTLGTLRTTEP
jgi:hypothetical protein